MNKWFIAIVLIALFQGEGRIQASRPNILLIVSEDNGPELSCYGEPYVKTPVLDHLAQEGVRFNRAYVAQAGCSQSRAALMTGLFPHQNGQIGLATWKFSLYREDTPNLVRSLKSAGYRTGIIGKLHIRPKSAFPFDFKKVTSSNFARKNLKEYAKEAKRFIGKSESDLPFFLSVNYPDAHRPFIKQIQGLPKKVLTAQEVKSLRYFGLDTPQLRAETADYYNCMQRLDALIGDLLEVLERSGKAKNTLVIYIGDHGADLLRGKRTSYEGGIRIPFIVRWPGRIKGNWVSHDLVSTLDILPTLLTVAQAKPIENLPGRSLLPLLRGEKVEWRKYLFTEFHLHSAHNFYPQRTVRNDRYKFIQNLMPDELNPGYDFTMNRFFAELQSAVDQAPESIRRAYARMRKPPQYELYDLKIDPYEFNNLAGEESHKQKFLELKNQLQEWRIRTEDPLLDPKNLKHLKAEIDACMEAGKPSKEKLKLSYSDYFFKKQP